MDERNYQQLFTFLETVTNAIKVHLNGFYDGNVPYNVSTAFAEVQDTMESALKAAEQTEQDEQTEHTITCSSKAVLQIRKLVAENQNFLQSYPDAYQAIQTLLNE